MNEEKKQEADQLIAEYTLLREELMENQKRADNYTTLAMTALFSICTLSYYLNGMNADTFLVGLLISFCLQHTVSRCRENMAKIGAYLKNYLEPRMTIRWETCNAKVRTSTVYPNLLRKALAFANRVGLWIVMDFYAMYLFVSNIGTSKIFSDAGPRTLRLCWGVFAVILLILAAESLQFGKMRRNYRKIYREFYKKDFPAGDPSGEDETVYTVKVKAPRKEE